MILVIDEASFPFECMTNDSTAKAIIENAKIPPEKVIEATSLIISIKVYGIKPNETT